MVEAREEPDHRTEEVDHFGRPLWTPNVHVGCLHSREEGFVFNWEPREQVYAENSLLDPVRQRRTGLRRSSEAPKWGKGAQCRYWRKLIEKALATSLGQGRTHSWDKLDGHCDMPRKKNRPWSSTLQAWWRWPFSDSSPFRLQKTFCDHTSNTAVILSNISYGSKHLQGHWVQHNAPYD